MPRRPRPPRLPFPFTAASTPVTVEPPADKRRTGVDFETDWARVVAPMAGLDRGTYFLPHVGDEVLVAFDGDDIRYPYVLGALWSRTDKVPEKNDDGKNAIRVIKTGPEGEIKNVKQDGVDVGEVVVEGNTCAKGYHKNPEATRTLYAGGMLHGRDKAVQYADGSIQILGRLRRISFPLVTTSFSSFFPLAYN